MKGAMKPGKGGRSMEAIQQVPCEDSTPSRKTLSHPLLKGVLG